jgi:hypothetical protein
VPSWLIICHFVLKNVDFSNQLADRPGAGAFIGLPLDEPETRRHAETWRHRLIACQRCPVAVPVSCLKEYSIIAARPPVFALWGVLYAHCVVKFKIPRI